MIKKSSKKPEKGDFKVLKETEKLLGYLVDKERQISATEDALVESMRRFRDLFEQSPAGIGIHSAAGDLLVINKSYLDVFGIDSFSKIEHHDLFSDFKLNSKQVKKLSQAEWFNSRSRSILVKLALRQLARIFHIYCVLFRRFGEKTRKVLSDI